MENISSLTFPYFVLALFGKVFGMRVYAGFAFPSCHHKPKNNTVMIVS